MAIGKIEISVHADGSYRMRGEFCGRPDSGSPVLTHEQVLARIPHLLREMRIQVDLDRCLDVEEGKALAARFAQSSCGSAVTV